MQKNAIEIKNLSKVYKLYDNKKDRLKEAFSISRKKYHKDFYALKNINLKIKKGSVIGFLGRNGAGKSTLLKVITGVLTPTSGNIVVDGRISALIELGAGFNNEYTGMENIYHYGTLMGFTKEEMNEKIDDIVNFADIGDFIYQPVKSYSSGMFARLAFSVAINIEPEILIVDEILSVGDFVFQHKCFNKFNEMMEKGVTILYVTHSTQQVLNYCNEAVFMRNGEIIYQSTDVKSVVFEYEKSLRNTESKNKEVEVKEEIQKQEKVEEVKGNEEINEKRMGTHEAYIKSLEIKGRSELLSECEKNTLISGDRVKFIFKIYSKREFKNIVLGVSILNVAGDTIWGDNTLRDFPNQGLKKGENEIAVEFDLSIVAGDYMIYAGLADLTNERVELDQRWPIQRISIISLKSVPLGKVYAPAEIKFY